MKNKEHIFYLAYCVVLVVLLLILINPLGFFMPSATEMILLASIDILLALFLGLVLKERPKDEREQLYLYSASRWSYIATVLFLSVAMLVQISTHTLDYWIPLAIVIAVVTKTAIYIYSLKSRN